MNSVSISSSRTEPKQTSMAGSSNDFSNGSGRVSGDGARPPQSSGFASTFASSSSTWNKNGIWGASGGFGINEGNTLYSGGNSNSFDAARSSGSVGASSQNDPWSGQTNPWNNLSNKSPPTSNPTSHSSSTTSQPTSGPSAPTGNRSLQSNPFGPSPFQGNQSMNGAAAAKNSLDPTSGSFVWGNGLNLGPQDLSRATGLGGFNITGDSYTSSPMDSDTSNFGRYNNGTEASRNGSASGSRSGSIPPLRNGNPSPRNGYGSYTGINASAFDSHPPLLSSGSQRSIHSGQNSVISSQSNFNRPESSGFDQANPQLANSFAAMNIGGQDRSSQPSFLRGPLAPDNRFNSRNNRFGGTNHVYGNGINPYPEIYAERTSSDLNGSSRRADVNLQPGQDQMRGFQNNMYSASATPPVYPDSVGAQSRGSTSSGPSHLGSQVPQPNAVVLDRKLRGLQQEQQNQPFYYPSSQNHLLMRGEPYRHTIPQTPYGYNVHESLQYPNFVNLQAARGPHPPPRGPARDQDTANNMMSPLMQEFKSNSKTSKRYELKDLYEHIVEFSGDQHGSRFIQQKLETANSDEKEQVFREIKPNALQLMTDVFGNYVIQKFFEHGNQNQKSLLAEQMKGHVLSLSLQMYGCRVVQKALEHILLDQQISFVKELQSNVMKCIQDQNGNHVIQKAIERVPQEHIQFVVEAVSGKVHPLATHNYGCRVVQRLLEHTDEATQQSLLKELHACTHNLVLDPYGNYVVQHILSNGKQEDRSKVIDVVASNVMSFSKNKCGSNVVERCMKTASKEQVSKILETIVGPSADKTNSLTLMKDQFGNYVIQSILHILKGAELEDFVEVISVHLASLKKLNYGNGKQIAAKIEKVISTLDIPRNHTPPPEASAEPTPPLLSAEARSPESSSHPSTTNSTIDGPIAAHAKDASRTEVRVVAIS